MTTFREFLDLSALGLPTVTRKGRITQVVHTANKVKVHLDDAGTTLVFNAHEARRISGGPPQRGRMMEVVMQRHPNDSSKDFSIIQSVKVI